MSLAVSISTILRSIITSESGQKYNYLALKWLPSLEETCIHHNWRVTGDLTKASTRLTRASAYCRYRRGRGGFLGWWQGLQNWWPCCWWDRWRSRCQGRWSGSEEIYIRKGRVVVSKWIFLIVLWSSPVWIAWTIICSHGVEPKLFFILMKVVFVVGRYSNHDGSSWLFYLVRQAKFSNLLV